VQNKANLPPAHIPLFHYSIIPLFQSDGNRAKQTQFGGARPGSQDANVQNEPNCSGRPGARRTRCAKRTQFPAGRDTPPFQYSIIPPFRSNADCAKRSQFVSGAQEWARAAGAGRPRRGLIVQNEPNCGRSFKFEVSSVKRIVQNEPNCASRDGAPEARDAGANAQNEANCPRTGPLREPIVRNKANLLRGHARPSPRPKALTLPPIRGHVRQTKPIRRGRAGRGEARQDGPCRRRWVKACETKPIPPKRQDGQVLCGKRVMAN
jgi:hypothetical protein